VLSLENNSAPLILSNRFPVFYSPAGISLSPGNGIDTDVKIDIDEVKDQASAMYTDAAKSYMKRKITDFQVDYFTMVAPKANSEAYWGDVTPPGYNYGHKPGLGSDDWNYALARIENDPKNYTRDKHENDPKNVPAKLIESRFPEVLERSPHNSFAGVFQMMDYLRMKYAPNVKLGYTIKTWGIGTDPFSEPAEGWDNSSAVQALADYLNNYDVQFDLLSFNFIQEVRVT